MWQAWGEIFKAMKSIFEYVETSSNLGGMEIVGKTSDFCGLSVGHELRHGNSSIFFLGELRVLKHSETKSRQAGCFTQRTGGYVQQVELYRYLCQLGSRLSQIGSVQKR